MKLFGVLLLLACLHASTAANNTVIIKYKDLDLSANSSDPAAGFPPPPPGVLLVADAPFLGFQIFQLTDPYITPTEYCQDLEMEDDNVAFCEPDSEVSLIAEQALPTPSAAPNDPLFGQQPNLKTIDLIPVWSQNVFGSPSVLVCFPDTGTSLDHPDLKQSIRNGTSFLGGVQSADYQDGNGHGTFVTGVVGALTNNGIGVAGVVQQPSIAACKFMDATGNGALSDAALCFNWCLQEQSSVISCSFGAPTFSAALQAAVQAASAQNVVFVASAGNEGINTDASPHYPSQFSKSLPGVITVAASDASNNLWTRSNYGATTVQIAAPGVSILGLGLGGSYVTLTGTSMSTPQVAGVAALLLSDLAKRASSLTKTAQINEAVKQGIVSTARNFSSRADTAKLTGGGIVDAAAALKAFRGSSTYAAASRSSISATVVAAVAGILVGIVLTLAAVGLWVYVQRLQQIRATRARAALDGA